MHLLVRWLALALLLPGGASAKPNDQVVTLSAPSFEVRLALDSGVKATLGPSKSFLRLYVEFPSGKSLREPPFPSPSLLLMFILPVEPGRKTQTEWMVSHALPRRPERPGGREWLVRETADLRVYARRTKSGDEPETHVFTGTDGSLVGVQLGYSIFLKNKASRRYMQDLEVTYQYPRELDARRMDEFVLTFLQRNLSILERGR
jgi:hypothetical protein